MKMKFFISAIFILNYVVIYGATPAIERNNPPELDWWENGVFYQIYPRSFKDSNGDGIGDLRGVIQKLDYLKELGVVGVWLSPIFKSPMADFGYDISDYYKVDPIFGTNADLEELFQKAKEINLKILLDFVPNHSSDEVEWFKKSVKRIAPYTDYFVWHDGKINNVTGERKPPNNWASHFYGPSWTWNKERQQYYYHKFVKEQPDLNYKNPLVHQEMKKILKFWLEKGAGGFRVDAVNYLYETEGFPDEPLTGLTDDPNSYSYTHHIYTKDLNETYEVIYDWREYIDNYQKKKGGNTVLLMTEAYTNASFYRKYFASDDNKRQGPQMPFNFELIERLNRTSTAHDFKKVIDDRLALAPAGKRMNWVMGNHDRPRVGSRHGEGRIDGFLMLVMTLPGIAVIYNGEEIGMLDNRDGISYKETQDPKACNLKETDNWKDMSRDPQRTPFQWDNTKWAGFSSGENAKPWLPIHPNYKDINLKLQKSFTRSTFKFFKQLVKLREDRILRAGAYESKVFNDNVLAYTRRFFDAYVVLINLGPREEHVDIHEMVTDFGDFSEVVVAGANTAYEIGDKVPTRKVFLRNYETIILKAAKSSSAVVLGSPVILILATVIRLFLNF